MDLLGAELSNGPGLPIPHRRKGAAGQGLRYEARFGRWLKKNGFTAIGNQWIAFFDANGHGFARPDWYIVQPQAIILFECKLSETDTAWAQIDYLYRPLLREIYSRPVVGIQVCKNLRNNPAGRLIEDAYAVVGEKEEKNWILHWLGMY